MLDNAERTRIEKFPAKPMIDGWYYEGDPEAEKAAAAGVNVTIIHSEEEEREKTATWLRDLRDLTRPNW